MDSVAHAEDFAWIYGNIEEQMKALVPNLSTDAIEATWDEDAGALVVRWNGEEMSVAHGDATEEKRHSLASCILFDIVNSQLKDSGYQLYAVPDNYCLIMNREELEAYCAEHYEQDKRPFTPIAEPPWKHYPDVDVEPPEQPSAEECEALLKRHPFADTEAMLRRMESLEFYRFETPATQAMAALEELERDLGAKLPDEYKAVVLHLGMFSGVPECEDSEEFVLITPSQAIELCNSWNFDDIPPNEFQTIGIGMYSCGGDMMGYVRNGNTFGPELWLLDHEMSLGLAEASLNDTVLAESLTAFLRRSLLTGGGSDAE
jgi:hypothetical protein